MLFFGLCAWGAAALCAVVCWACMRRAEAAAEGAEQFAANAAYDAARAKVQSDRASGFRETRRGLR
jgi:dihydroxyacetone kinase